MTAALTNQLRESLLLERARKIYRIVWMAAGNENERVDLIRDILRITRDEGIATGIDQAQRFEHELEKAT